MIKCKHCGSAEYIKNGFVNKKQRYKCKLCRKTSREGDLREVYSNEKRLRVIKWYLEGAGIMSIERMEGVPNPLIIRWIRQFSKLVRKHLSSVEVPENAKDIEIIEIDELFTYCQKKTNKIYVWLAVDRNRNQVIDIAVSKRREKRVFVSMALRLENKGYRVAILCTDGYEGYASYALGRRHVVSKAETALVEAKNSLIRHYLARFNRRSKRYSKAIDMIFHSLNLLFNKRILTSIFS